MSATEERIAALQAALVELLAQRSLFSEPTYQEIVQALNEKLQLLRRERPLDTNEMSRGDEIRLVTVMFVDVEGSTRLAQILQDDWKKMINDVHRRLAKVVSEWDGEIGQYLGDGMLCFFGAQRSRDDDATRAVSCALAVQQAVKEFTPYFKRRYNETFTLRIGITSGRVVVGVIGTAEKSEFLALGAATNLAARLQQLCPSGEVMIDNETYSRVREQFHSNAQPPVTIKGFDAQVRTYLVTGRRQRSARLSSGQVTGLALPFIGREAEMRHLRRFWNDARTDGEMHVVTLYGEIGVGKSRLLEEARAAADADGFTVLTIAPRYELRILAHNLLHDLLSDLCGLSENQPREMLEKQLRDCIAANWPDEDPDSAAVAIGRLAGFDFEDAPAAVVDPLPTVARWLRALANNRPLMLVIDNLQWADAASLELLEYLALALVDYPGVIMGTARPEFVWQRPGYMPICARSTEINIGRLSDDATRAIIESVAGHVENPPVNLLTQIVERSQGNPLFVEEFLRTLFDTGIFEQVETDHWRVNSFVLNLNALELPGSLLGVFQARLDDLPMMTRRVVQAASVVGEHFWRRVVDYLMGFDTTSILNDLVGRGIINPLIETALEGQNEYAFRHTLYREVAYTMLTRSDREDYHQRIAEWLSDFVAAQPIYLRTLAEHMVNGGKYEQALSMYLAAVVNAVDQKMLPESLKLIEQGLDASRYISREHAVPLVAQLWLWQSKALLGLARYGEASAAGSTALMLLDELPPGTLGDARREAERVLAAAGEQLPKPKTDKKSK